ncbi:RING finger protein 151-like isoform X2 [Pantherophis guttatus]|uniref:RING finger protein 151-like isoform X2 n=1 Tax=Pantherophis guttatus TaxID=94885 RepID=A0A6P9CGM0_PANGU|nr:RING finger protein 151-like isoform X2 [Pantherophis guttatus]
MGYDMDRFVGHVNEGLICCICRGVLQDPLQAPCEHAFCTSCIYRWLLQHNSCPEDRQSLDLSVLRPLYRYMRNDLNQLQLHCTNKDRGCEIVCSLESIDSHECDCEYSQIPCPNNACPVQVERRNLYSHVASCEFRAHECPNGCGYIILGPDDAQHNCVAELRTELELLRSDIICQMEDKKQEMQSRLNSQRRHMVKKESLLQKDIEQLKSQMSKMMSKMQDLMATERQHRQELEQAELGKRELLEIMKNFQKDSSSPRNRSRKAPHSPPPARLHTMKLKIGEATAL